MNVTQGDRAGEDGICVRWMSIPTVERRGRNKQMMGKKLTLSLTVKLQQGNIRNGKQRHVYTSFRYSNIQIKARDRCSVKSPQTQEEWYDPISHKVCDPD